MTRFFSNLLKLVICCPDELGAVGSLQPAHDEVPAGHVLKMVDEEEVYHGTPGSSQDRNRLGDRLLGNGHPKAGSHLGYEPDDNRSAFLNKTPFSDVLRRLGHGASHGGADREISHFRRIVRSRAAP